MSIAKLARLQPRPSTPNAVRCREGSRLFLVKAPPAAPQGHERRRIEPLECGTSDASTKLVELLRKDPSGATELLHRQFAPTVKRIVSSLLGRDPEQQDLVQLVFLRVLTHGHRLRDPERLANWIRGIAVHTVYEELRRRKRCRAILDLARSNTPANFVHDVETLSSLKRVQSGLNKLPPSQRDVFVLYYLEGYTLARAAEIGGYSLSTAKRRLATATAWFAKVTRNEPELLELVRQAPHHT